MYVWKYAIMFFLIQNDRGFTLIYATCCVFWWLLLFSFHSYTYWVGVCGCLSFFLFFFLSLPPPPAPFLLLVRLKINKYILRYSRYFFNSSIGCVFSSLVEKFFLLFKTIYVYFHDRFTVYVFAGIPAWIFYVCLVLYWRFCLFKCM